MSAVVLAAIDAAIAELVREVPTPTGDLMYGRDLSCVSGLTDDLAEVAEDSPRGISQALVRRYTTARGGLPDDPDYGIDIRAYANRPTSTQELQELAGRMRSEASKDDRIADATITLSYAESELAVAVRIQPADPRIEPFSLTLTVTSGTVIMEAIS